MAPTPGLGRWRTALCVSLAAVLAAPAVAAQAADTVKPILLHHTAASPPIWCDNSTIVYAVKLDTKKSHLRSIVAQTIPGGEPRELFRDSGSAVPYQCADGRILYLTLEASDCDTGAEEKERQAVYVADVTGKRAPLSCGPGVALLSPDRRSLATSTKRLMPEGVRLLAGNGKALLIVDLRKPDLSKVFSGDGRVTITDHIISRVDPAKVQREYALGNGAIRWLSNHTLAISLINLDTGELLLRTIQLEPRTGNLAWSDRVPLGTKGFLIFDNAGEGRLYAWSTSDALRQVQECRLSERKMSCMTLALDPVLNKADAGMAAGFDADVDFRDNSTVWFMADVGNSECLMRLNIATGSHECMVDHTERLIVASFGQFRRLAISPDGKWLAYIVLNDLGRNGSSDLMLLPLPE